MLRKVLGIAAVAVIITLCTASGYADSSFETPNDSDSNPVMKNEGQIVIQYIPSFYNTAEIDMQKNQEAAKVYILPNNYGIGYHVRDQRDLLRSSDNAYSDKSMSDQNFVNAETVFYLSSYLAVDVVIQKQNNRRKKNK